MHQLVAKHHHLLAVSHALLRLGARGDISMPDMPEFAVELAQPRA
jgi:hypothetical protein